MAGKIPLQVVDEVLGDEQLFVQLHDVFVAVDPADLRERPDLTALPHRARDHPARARRLTHAFQAERTALDQCSVAAQHLLCLRPLPHGQGSLRPTFGEARRTVSTTTVCRSGSQ